MSEWRYVMFCPFHKDANVPNLFIDEYRIGHCFACGWHGPVTQIMVAKGVSGVDLLTRQSEFLKEHAEARASGLRSLNGIQRPKDDWKSYEQDPAGFKYLIEQRRFLPETLRAFETKSWRGLIYGWETYSGWITRWWDGTYLYDPNFDRSNLYGNAEAYADEHPGYARGILLVEGILDAMRVYQSQAKFPVLATLGGPTEKQAERLIRRECKVYELFDNDQGGDAHRNLLHKLGVPFTSIKYGEPGQDPADCDDFDIRVAIEEAING